MTPQFADMMSLSIFLTLPCYWYKAYVNIMTDSGAMTIFAQKRLTGKSGNRQYLV